MLTRFTCFCSLLILLLSCGNPISKPPQRAAYYWQSVFQWQQAEQEKSDHLGLERLYVKFFDVKFDPATRAQPVAVLDVQSPFPDSLTLVPVVFVTNDCLIKLTAEEMAWLAARIAEKVNEIWQIGQGGPRPEIQVDCDWTASTQDRYFTLLKELKLVFPKTTFSVTLRLYPFRYPEKMGVPPVDRAMLMYYNMGELKNPAESNSILNNETARAYLDPAAKYPLPLDIALPAFSWGVAFRNDQFLGLIRDLNIGMTESSGFFTKFASNTYQSTQDTVWRGTYFREGDVVRLEMTDPEALLEAAQLTAPLRDKADGTVSFFQWHSPNFSSLADENLEPVFDIYR